MRIVFQDEETGDVFPTRSQAKKWEKIRRINARSGFLSYEGYQNLQRDIRLLERQQKNLKSLLSKNHQNQPDAPRLQFAIHYKKVALSYLYSVVRDIHQGRI